MIPKYPPLAKDFPHFLIGGDYNPEQFLDAPDILTADVEMMKEAGCNEMTMAIHAWDSLETSDGVFDFSWLDERMDAIYKAGGRVILATPSAARPRWLASAHPEIMMVNEHGERLPFGWRQNVCLNSPVYRAYVTRINEKLAQRYANHPALIAWHLSNEYNAHSCYCPVCREKFCEWVKKKYGGDLKRLNHEWWTPYWSQQIQSFEQIDPPARHLHGHALTGLCLDWFRFLSDTLIDFAKCEINAVRKYSDKPITTNCMGRFRGYDHYKMAEQLDFFSNDTYPTFWKGILSGAERVAFNGSLCRNMKGGKPYILMESAPGINIAANNFMPLKSTEVQIFEALSSVAEGADSVMYFQWRKSRGGIEKYHGAIVGADGRSDHRVFQAVKTIAGYLKKLDGVIGTQIPAEVAVIRDYDTMWALDGYASTSFGEGADIPRDRSGYDKTIADLFSACFRRNVALDIIGYHGDFSKYKILFVPSPYIMTPAIADKLRDFAKNGGVVVGFYLAGMVNENDLTYLGDTPACGLCDLFGMRVNEITDYSAPGCVLKNAVRFSDRSYPIHHHAELTEARTAETLGTYEDDFFANSPALLCNRFGKGFGYYVAFQPESDFLQAFSERLFETHGVACGFAEIRGGEHVHVTLREGDGERYFFVSNLSDTDEEVVTLGKPFRNLLTDETETDKFTLPPLGVAVLKESK